MFFFPKDLKEYGIIEGKKTTLNFESGVKVKGEIITGKRDLQGKIILISFKDCTVTFLNQVLFKPNLGIYDMVVGESIKSAFAGPASPDSFDDVYSRTFPHSKVKNKWSNPCDTPLRFASGSGA